MFKMFKIFNLFVFLSLFFLISCVSDEKEETDNDFYPDEKSDITVDEDTDNADDYDNISEDADNVDDSDDIPDDGLDESFITPNRGLAFKMISMISSDIGDIKTPETIKAELLVNGTSEILDGEGSHIMAGLTKLYIVLAGKEVPDKIKYEARIVIPIENLESLTNAGFHSFDQDGDFYRIDVIKQWKKNDDIIKCPIQINESPLKKDQFYAVTEGMKWIGEEKMSMMINARMENDPKKIAEDMGTLFYYQTCSCFTVVEGEETARECTFEDVGETPPECVQNSDCYDNSNGKTACDLHRESETFLTCIEPIEVNSCTDDSDCINNTNGKISCDMASESSTFNSCVKPNEICRNISFETLEWRGLNAHNGYTYIAKIDPNLGEDQEVELGKIIPDYLYFEFYGDDYSFPVTFDLGDSEHDNYDLTKEAIIVRENETDSYYGRTYFQSEGTLKLEKVQLNYGKTEMTEHSKGEIINLKLVEMDNDEAPLCLRVNGSWDTTVAPVCGNGKIEEYEDCDDGNEWDSDGCSSVCKIEDNYNCINEPSNCSQSTDPCSTVNCSGHGTCNVVDGSPVCSCEENYGNSDTDKTVCLLLGNTCEAPMVTVNVSGKYMFNTSITGYTNNFAPSETCSTAYENSSLDYVFKLELDRKSSVVIDISAFVSSSPADTVLYISDTCGTSTIACNDDKETTNYLSKIEKTLETGIYYIVLDTFYGDSGSFTVDVEINDPEPVSNCTKFSLKPIQVNTFSDGTVLYFTQLMSNIGDAATDELTMEFYGASYVDGFTSDLASAVNSNYQTCEECLLLTADNGNVFYYPTSGTLMLEQIIPEGSMSKASKGKIISLRMDKVDIDWGTMESTVITGDNAECVELETQFEWNTTL